MNFSLLCKCRQSGKLIFHACLSSQGAFPLQAPCPWVGRLVEKALVISRVLSSFLLSDGCFGGSSQAGCPAPGTQQQHESRALELSSTLAPEQALRVEAPTASMPALLCSPRAGASSGHTAQKAWCPWEYRSGAGSCSPPLLLRHFCKEQLQFHLH